MVNKGLEHIHFIETYNINIATFRCDNAGENITFKEKVQIGKNRNVEFLAPNIPQQNKAVKRALAMLYNRV